MAFPLQVFKQPCKGPRDTVDIGQKVLYHIPSAQGTHGVDLARTSHYDYPQA